MVLGISGWKTETVDVANVIWKRMKKKNKLIKAEAEKTALRLSSFTTSPEHCIVLHPCCKVTYPLQQHPVEEVGRQGVKSMWLHILHLKQQGCKMCSFSVFKTLDSPTQGLERARMSTKQGELGAGSWA